MAAPSGTVWGSIAYGNSESSRGGRIGIYVGLSNSDTKTTVNVEVWFWSKYGVDDSSNTLYYNNLSSSGSATSSVDSSNIKTTVSSGEGWSTSNQVKLYSKSHTYTRGTSAVKRYLYAKLTDVDRVAATMSVSTTFTIPALASYKVYYSANGGEGAPSTQTKYYDKPLTLSSTKPTRSGYTFQGWGTSATDTTVDYDAGDSYTDNETITLRAIWKKTIKLTYNANSGSGAPAAQSADVYNATTSYKFTLSSIKPTRTGYTFLGWSTSSSATSASYSAGGTITLSSSDTLYAVWKINTYTVSYNANGGSGAPSSQTKTYGKTLTLSSTKPTRTGYTFQGWGTSATDTTVDYAAGGSYTANAGDTLYAIWKINTYTVSYNANGGSGAPSSQTKEYGKTLTLSSVKPTRTNYTFVGWATSASETSATYSAGGSYTANSAVTLYAIWTLAYQKPSITNLSVKRCDGNGNITNDGTNALIAFNWVTTLYDVQSITVEFVSGSTRIQRTISASGKNGSVSKHIKDLELPVDTTYTVILTVDDGYDLVSKSITLPGTVFVLDFLAGGKGAAFGKSATDEGVLDIAFKTRFRGGIDYVVLPEGTDLNDVKAPGFYVGQNASTVTYHNCPLTRGTFTLDVSSGGPNGQVYQRLTLCDKTNSKLLERWYYIDSWGDWFGDWKRPAELGAHFTVYGVDNANRPQYRKVGQMVEIKGVLTPTVNIAGGVDQKLMFSMESGYAPSTSIYTICQGSGACTWVCQVATNGNVIFTRYRDSSGFAAVTPPTYADDGSIATDGTWLPFHVTYFTN